MVPDYFEMPWRLRIGAIVLIVWILMRIVTRSIGANGRSDR
jgi:hypothetical protein